MSIVAVADTHAVVWYLYDDPRLSRAMRTMMDDAAARGDLIAMSSMSLAEMIFLIERGRIDSQTFDQVISALDLTDGVLVEHPFDRSMAQAMRLIDRALIPELPDRIIAATALHLGIPLISRDHKIQASGLLTLW